ncbi:hypothetical protein pb186bvf_015605 [Paramecium bursaria]
MENQITKQPLQVNRSKEYKNECRSLLETINKLQLQIKRSPELYAKEISQILAQFKEHLSQVLINPGFRDEKFLILSQFLSKVAVYYKTDMAFYIDDLIELINHNQDTLNPEVRKKVIFCLLRLRGKNLIEPYKMIIFLMKLFNCKDKDLRKLIYKFILKDIKQINKDSQQVLTNKKIQSFIIDVLKKSKDNISKRAIQIMIELFRKNVWKDEKAINIISQGCFNTNYKIQLLAAYFLIETTQQKLDSDSESEEEFLQKKGKNKSVKPTKAREHRLNKQKKAQLKKQKKKLQNTSANIYPLDHIFNPQDYAERLFNQLKKQDSDKFQIKLALMHLISRLINRHKLMLLQYYTYIQKYLYPNNKDIAKLFAYLAESIHDQIPREELCPLIKHIIDQFISDRCSDLTITMGIRTLYLMIQKHPFLLEKQDVMYLVNYNKYKNRNVTEAARSIINYYQENNPQLLDKKHRGRQWKKMDEEDEENQQLPEIYQQKVCTEIEGAMLLQKEEEEKLNIVHFQPIYYDRVLTDEDFKRIRALQRKKQAEEQQTNSQQKMEVEEVLEDGQDEDYTSISGESDVDDGDDWSDNIKSEISEMEQDSVQDYYSGESESVDENPLGLVNEDDIVKYRQTKSERKQQLREQLENNTKEKWYKGRNKKKSEFQSKTNEEKLKFKPLQMVRQKRLDKSRSEGQLKKKIKKLKSQLGHVRNKKEYKKKVQNSKK